MSPTWGHFFLEEDIVILLPAEDISEPVLGGLFKSLLLGVHLDALGNFPPVTETSDLEQALATLGVEEAIRFLNGSEAMLANGSQIATLVSDRATVADDQGTPHRDILKGADVDADRLGKAGKLMGKQIALIGGIGGFGVEHFNYLVSFVLCLYYSTGFWICQALF